MKDTLSAFQTIGPVRHQGVKLGLFVLWLCLVSFMGWSHAFFSDEVRALSLALQGENVIEMLKAIHGEGHPALWYLLLRTAHFVVGSPVVLPLVSIGIAAAAALLLVLRSPFRWWMIALLLLSRFLLYEYSVMARNYGISVLLLFLLANYYPRYRDRGVLLGIFLFLLANTNAPSVLLAGAFLLYWSIDILFEYGFRWTQPLKTFLVNAAISAAGMATCFATIYPTYNDAALAPPEITLKLLVKAVLLPAESIPHMLWPGIGAVLSDIQIELLMSLMSLMLFGSLLGLIRSPGAFIAGLAALITLSLFFHLIYEGGYRHYCLGLVFLVSMYWTTRARGTKIELPVPGRLKFLIGPASAIGSTLMVVLMALQVPAGVNTIVRAALDGPPESRARDFSVFVASRSDLQNAIIIADPDNLLEALPYYVNNRTYLMRERRFGNWVKYTKNARLSIDLDDILAAARMLRMESSQPIIILLHEELDPSQPRIYQEFYNWKLVTTPEQVRDFLTSTRFLAQFAPALSEESFNAYFLDLPKPTEH